MKLISALTTEIKQLKECYQRDKNELIAVALENDNLKEDKQKLVIQLADSLLQPVDTELFDECNNLKEKLEKIEELYKNSPPYDQNLGIKLKGILSANQMKQGVDVR